MAKRRVPNTISKAVPKKVFKKVVRPRKKLAKGSDDPMEFFVNPPMADPEDECAPVPIEDFDAPLEESSSAAERDILTRYPPPRKNPEFRKRWGRLIVSVATRENFRKGHLYQLEVLCDLYVEYHNLAKFIRTNGYTYSTDGRNGVMTKTHPEVQLLSAVRSDIRNYSKMLGLVLVKDASGESDTEGDSWD